MRPTLTILPTFLIPFVSSAATTVFPPAAGETTLSEPIVITGTFDGGMKRFNRDNGCKEGEGGRADAVFHVESGGTLENVIIGPSQTEGVQCLGPCTIRNVWWEDVCEDALTILQESGVSRIIGGGARHAEDKIIQHNGGGTVEVTDFFALDFGKVYRSCGNCKGEKQFKGRRLVAEGVVAQNGSTIAGVNENFGDVAEIKGGCVAEVKDTCQRFEGNDTGEEPEKIGAGDDGETCIIDESVEVADTCL